MIFEKIRDIVANQLGIDPESIKPESRLIEDLKADSLDVVELIMDLEQEFETEIPDTELPNIKSIGDIVKYLEKKD